MDLSGIIFVVLAIGWAAYLLPMALRHHDEVDQRQPVEEFSGSLRVLGHAVKRTVTSSPAASVVEPAETRPPVVEPVETGSRVPTSSTTGMRSSTTGISREAARTAAARRRRVLALLLSLLVAVTVTSYLTYTPWFTTAIPGGLIVAFLVVARLTVRAQQVRRVAPVQHTGSVSVGGSVVEPAETPVETTHAELDAEDTEGLSRADLDEVLAAPVMDDGGLWDPLPVTLPTYVSKARARRTVRTVELTGAMTSSGHDAADSALAREAAAAEAASAPEVESGERRVAGA